MESKEDKQLKRIMTEYGKAVVQFQKKDYKKAEELFRHVTEKYAGSEYYSVLEIQGRASVYQKIALSGLNPIKLELSNDTDYLQEGIYCLNEGNLDRAQEMFTFLKDKNNKDPYLDYLLSMVFLKQENEEKSLDYLSESVEKDPFYKILAFNEPDWQILAEDERFLSLISE